MKKKHSILQVLKIVSKLETSTKRLPELLGFRSTDISKSFKKLITLCNSLSIIFEQYNLHSHALELLHKASEADKGLKRYGSSSDRLWQGSLITSCNLAHLFHKVGQYPASIKLIYEAQSFLLLIKKSEEFVSPDVELCVQMITFVTLWKLRKFVEAKEYLEAAAGILNKVIKGVVESKMSKNSYQNLYCLVVLSLAGLKIVIKNEVKEGQKMCEDCKNQLESNPLCIKLVNDFIARVSSKSFGKEDFLITEIYSKVLFVTTFIPLISPNTPLIKLSELESENNKSEEEDLVGSYKHVKSKERLESSRVSRRGCKSTPRSDLVKPWWESNKIFDKPAKNRAVEAGFRSEPRGKEKIKFSPHVIPTKLPMRRSKDSFYSEVKVISRFRQLKDAKEAKDLKQIKDLKDFNGLKVARETRGCKVEEKEHIMFEFNPGVEGGSGEYQVQLVPLNILKSKNLGKDRQLTNFHNLRNGDLG